MLIKKQYSKIAAMVRNVASLADRVREFDEKVGPLEKQLSGLYEQLDDCTPKVRTEETKDFKGARESLYNKYKQK